MLLRCPALSGGSEAVLRSPSRAQRKPEQTGHLFSHSETGEWGLSGSAEPGIRSYSLKKGDKAIAPDSFTVTPFLKSLVAVRPIEDN